MGVGLAVAQPQSCSFDTDHIALMRLTGIPSNQGAHTRGPCPFYAAIDTGATRTLCSRRLAELLFGIWQPGDVKSFKLFNGEVVQYDVMLEELKVQKQDKGANSFGDVNFVDQELPFSKYLPEDSDMPKEIDMIIGADCVWQHVFNQLFTSGSSNLLLSGQRIDLEIGQLWLSTATHIHSSINHISAIHQPAIIAKTEEAFSRKATSSECGGSKIRLTRADRENDMQKLENDPFYQSVDDERIAISNQDETVLNLFQNTVKEVTLEDGKTHLQFRLPWAEDPSKMKDNFEQAKTALLRLRKKLSSQPDLRAKYCEKIESAIDAGHIVKLQNEPEEDTTPKYYLPHFNTSQSKFRVVYDAAREYRGTSLNSLLARGPIFMQSLQSVLFRFGERQFGIAGDVANMFFQIRVHPDDCDMLRVLWFDQPDMGGNIAKFRFQVAPYGLKCIPSIV